MRDPKRGRLEEKAQLRAALRLSLERVTAEQSIEAGEAVARHLCGVRAWAEAETIALYVTLPGEVETAPLIRAARSAGKTVAFPRMIDGGSLEFAVVEDGGELMAGRHGVMEPDRCCPLLALSERVLVLVPGLAFDRAGGRLGRGAGYYDRALAEPRALEAGCESGGRPRRLGIGFALQILEQVPMTPLDVRMDGVVTDLEFVLVG